MHQMSLLYLLRDGNNRRHQQAIHDDYVDYGIKNLKQRAAADIRVNVAGLFSMRYVNVFLEGREIFPAQIAIITYLSHIDIRSTVKSLFDASWRQYRKENCVFHSNRVSEG